MNFIYGLLVGITSGDVKTKLVDPINTIANAVLGVLGLGILAIAIYVGFKFFTAEDEDKRKNAKGQMIYAIIGVVVIIAILVLWNTVIVSVLESQVPKTGGGAAAEAGAGAAVGAS